MPTPPGWYPDPRGKPGQWYWDGESWDYDAAEAAAARTPTIKPSTKAVLVGVAAGAISGKLAGSTLSAIWDACDIGINNAANSWGLLFFTMPIVMTIAGVGSALTFW